MGMMVRFVQTFGQVYYDCILDTLLLVFLFGFYSITAVSALYTQCWLKFNAAPLFKCPFIEISFKPQGVTFLLT